MPAAASDGMKGTFNQAIHGTMQLILHRTSRAVLVRVRTRHSLLRRASAQLAGAAGTAVAPWLMGRNKPPPRDSRRTAPPPLPVVDGGSWPAGVSFIGDYVWALDVGTELRAKYAGESTRREPASPSCCTAVRIKHITDARHPACGEFGLVASGDLIQGQHILDYLGAVSVAEDRTSDYVVDFGEHSELALDALTVGNEARFVRSAPTLARPLATP